MSLSHYIYKKYLDIKYWILYRTINKYHIINTGLKPGYYDADYRLLHGMFSILVEFVEKEMDRCNWDVNDSQANVEKEIKELYKWWKEVYPYYDKNSPSNLVDPPEISGEPCVFDKDGKPMLYKMVDKFKDNEHETKYNEMLKSLKEYNDNVSKETKNNMTRLVNIYEYLWT